MEVTSLAHEYEYFPAMTKGQICGLTCDLEVHVKAKSTVDAKAKQGMCFPMVYTAGTGTERNGVADQRKVQLGFLGRGCFSENSIISP